LVSYTKEKHGLDMSENRVLRRIFGPKWEEVAGDCKRFHNKEPHNLYDSSNVIRVIKSKSIIGAVHVARMGEMINTIFSL